MAHSYTSSITDKIKPEMQVHREKTTSWTGLIVSVLLHGIFFAGCLALDANTVSATAGVDASQPAMTKVTEPVASAKPKS